MYCRERRLCPSLFWFLYFDFSNQCQRHKDKFVITRQKLIAVIFSKNTGSHE